MSQKEIITKNFDEKFMSYAINLAKKNLGITASNPVVGCVIICDGEIIATGVTAALGRPHAETIAIGKIFDKEILKKATLYVTLEPCSHFGKTAPCVDEIIKHQFKKVVIAAQDPDSRVNGAGIKKLLQARIEVVCGVKEKAAQEINRGFFSSKEKGRPFVTLKLATSLDGKIATKNFDSKWITSEKSRQFSHYLRSINDAILVGANTIRNDDPGLDCRIPGLENFSPKRVILSRNLELNSKLNPLAKVFQNCDKIATIILTPTRDKKSPSSAAEIIFFDEKKGLKDALEKLCQSGINSLLIEGGAKVATEFLQENLVDELVWIRSQKIIGNDGIAAIGNLGFSKLDEVLTKFQRQEIRELEDDLVEIYRAR